MYRPQCGHDHSRPARAANLGCLTSIGVLICVGAGSGRGSTFLPGKGRYEESNYLVLMLAAVGCSRAGAGFQPLRFGFEFLRQFDERCGGGRITDLRKLTKVSGLLAIVGDLARHRDSLSAPVQRYDRN